MLRPKYPNTHAPPARIASARATVTAIDHTGTPRRRRAAARTHPAPAAPARPVGSAHARRPGAPRRRRHRCRPRPRHRARLHAPGRRRHRRLPRGRAPSSSAPCSTDQHKRADRPSGAASIPPSIRRPGGPSPQPTDRSEGTTHHDRSTTAPASRDCPRLRRLPRRRHRHRHPQPRRHPPHAPRRTARPATGTGTIPARTTASPPRCAHDRHRHPGGPGPGHPRRRRCGWPGPPASTAGKSRSAAPAAAPTPST